MFIFVSVHHHGRRDHAAGHRDHVHAPEDGVLPDPEPGRGALAGAAPTLISWKVISENESLQTSLKTPASVSLSEL